MENVFKTTDDWAGLYNLTIHAVYQSVQEDDPWRNCLALMARYFQAAKASIVVQPSAAGAPGFLVRVPAGDEAMPDKNDPFAGLPPERAMAISDPASARHVMGINIATQAGTIAHLRMYRCQHLPPFSAQDKQRLAMFAPHIKQALTLTAHLNCNESQMQIYEEGLERLKIGVIVLDDTAQLLRANPTASQILDRADGVKLVERRLAASTLAETRQLRRLVAGAREHPGQVTAMGLSRPSGRRKLAAVVRSLPLLEDAAGRASAVVALYLRDPDTVAAPSSAIARQLFDFTPAEAHLAIELLNGLSLDEAAGKLGIQRNTGRAHLRAIFSKTGVTRQSELIRVLLNGMLGLSTMED